MKKLTKITVRLTSYGKFRVRFFRTWPYGWGEFENSAHYPTRNSMRRLVRCLNARDGDKVTFIDNGYDVEVG